MNKRDRLKAGYSCVIDPSFLPERLRAKLDKILQAGPLTPEQRLNLIEACGKWAQMNPAPAACSPAEVKKEMEQLASDAHRLLNTLGRLSREAVDTFQAHEVRLIYGSAPQQPIGHEVLQTLRTQPQIQTLPHAYDWVAALRVMAEQATAELDPSSKARPPEEYAKDCARFAAGHIRSISGKLPPSSRDTWFHSFVDHFLKYQIPELKVVGPRIISAAVGSYKYTEC